jgi:phosphatidylglycerol---prolipoprotein diacylglyceryl transferase
MASQAPQPWVHQVFELLAYAVGARLYWRASASLPRPAMAVDRWLIVGGAIFGAMVGSKTLHLLEHLGAPGAPDTLTLWLSGKSVLGGFLGGTLGVEMAKKAIGWRPSTGDAWVLALAVGLAIGRLGCHYSGVWDQTYGVPTHLPWAWDHGDGVLRHPVALYEAGAVLVAGWWVARHVDGQPGRRFAVFMLAYCIWRWGVEFLKPPYGPDSALAAQSIATLRHGGLTAIQWAALAGAAYFGVRVSRLRR